jgi:hypothetical protein
MSHHLNGRLKQIEAQARARRDKALSILARLDAFMSIPALAPQPGIAERVSYWLNQATDPNRRRLAELLQVAKERYESQLK